MQIVLSGKAARDAWLNFKEYVPAEVCTPGVPYVIVERVVDEEES